MNAVVGLDKILIVILKFLAGPAILGARSEISAVTLAQKQEDVNATPALPVIEKVTVMSDERIVLHASLQCAFDLFETTPGHLFSIAYRWA